MNYTYAKAKRGKMQPPVGATASKTPGRAERGYETGRSKRLRLNPGRRPVIK